MYTNAIFIYSPRSSFLCTPTTTCQELCISSSSPSPVYHCLRTFLLFADRTDYRDKREMASSLRRLLHLSQLPFEPFAGNTYRVVYCRANTNFDSPRNIPGLASTVCATFSRVFYSTIHCSSEP